MSTEAEAPRGGRMRPALAIFLVVGSVLVGVGLSELGYRVVRRFVCLGAVDVQVYRRDPEYGWAHRPNSSGWLHGCIGREFEWRVHTRINGLGLRDRERTYEKPPGTTRVLLLGDSMTEAMQVPIEKTFATLLEANVRGGGVPIEVINTGTAVYGTDNALTFFRSEGVRYAPDVVVLVFNVANDVLENSQTLNARLYGQARTKLIPKKYFHVDAAGELVRATSAFPAPEPRSLWQRIEDQVYLLRAFHRLVAPPPAPVSSSAHEVMKTTPDPEWLEAWRLTEALIRALRTDVEEAGAGFAVAVMPRREAVTPEMWRQLQFSLGGLREPSYDPAYPVARLTAFLEREGIRHVDLLPPLRQAAQETGVTGFFVWDAHLDAAGHAVVANALTPFVADLVRSRGR